MFFRLSKNSIKNVYFDPFGGGYPPSPLNSLYIASAYAFLRKSSIFNKKLIFFIFLFWGGRDYAVISPPADCWGVANMKCGRGANVVSNYKGRIFLFELYNKDLVLIKLNLGGGGRVRTRNTLHVVGARTLPVCDIAVSPRACREAGGADTS
jgi:hypothetical protein